jgi:ADP-heptose:LPS heptosyltransferase
LRRYPKRVVIHPKSSRESKNWPWQKFANLAEELEQEGFEPWFILTPAEKETVPPCRCPDLRNLSEMAHFVAESGAMIGNDSGIGHLASCLGLPTVTICRHKQASLFWRPAWSPGTILTPPQLLPNLKGMRWRDKYWKHCISVGRVQNAFLDLYGNSTAILS